MLDQKTLKTLSTDYANAWSSKSAQAVASFYEPDAYFSLNGDAPAKGVSAIADVIDGFHTSFPDMKMMCDGVRGSGSHVLFLWTFYGHHFETKAFVRLSGWEEWDLSKSGKIQSAKGWFDTVDFENQIAGKGH